MVGRMLVRKMVPVSPDWNWIVLPDAVLACTIAERSVGQLRLEPDPAHEPNESARVVTVYVFAATAFVPANMPKATERPTAIRPIRANQPSVLPMQFESFLRQDR
jgi:hypothetical protein